MRRWPLVCFLVAGIGVTGVVTAAPTDQKPSDPGLSPESEDVHVTVTAGRGRLGFSAMQIGPELRMFFGAPSDRGVLVDKLRPDSPAARAGLRVGDVILDVDAAPATSVEAILSAIADRKKGDTVPIALERGRARMTLQVKLDSDPGPQQLSGPADGRWHSFGSDQMPFDLHRMFGDPDLRRELEATRERVEQLERRIERLEHR